MSDQNAHYDGLETRHPAEREAALMAGLAEQVAHAQAHAPAYTERLAGVGRVDSREALAGLPLTRKSELATAQAALRGRDRFGGYAAQAPRRIFQSPGPIYEPEGQDHDPWRVARAMHAAGFRPGELCHVGFSYHLTPAGAFMEAGLRLLGCASFPGGVGNTEQQVQAVLDLRPEAFAGTPSALRILVEKLGERSPFTKALVSGEACPPALVDWFAARGVTVYQCYATADLGLIAYETPAREGLVVDEGVIVEIVRPGSGDTVPEGEVGEVVVTSLAKGYPLIRFATGDLSAAMPGQSPCGRSNMRLRGWLGRADQSAKVKGMFVHASQVADLMRRHPELARARLVVEGELAQDKLTLQAELRVGLPEAAAAEALAVTLRDLTKLRGEVELVPPGGLPNDGKLIEDRRAV
jgi:phenylacetate-CoA ligase